MVAGIDVPLKDLTKDQAKYFLATIALKRLSTITVAVSRNELFSPTADEKYMNAPNITKAGTQKDWQRQFVNKLMEHGWVEQVKQGGSLRYIACNRDALYKILDNVRDGDGVSLKSIMWPKLFLDEADADLGSEEPEGEESAAPSNMGVIQEVADQLSAMVGPLQSIAEGFKSHDVKLDKHASELVDVRKYIFILAKGVDEAVKRIEVAVAKVLDEDRRKIADVSTVLADIFARRRSVENQLNSINRLEEKAMESLNEALERMKGAQGVEGAEGKASK